jgi:hypothetical protein
MLSQLQRRKEEVSLRFEESEIMAEDVGERLREYVDRYNR